MPDKRWGRTRHVDIVLKQHRRIDNIRQLRMVTFLAVEYIERETFLLLTKSAFRNESVRRRRRCQREDKRELLAAAKLAMIASEIPGTHPTSLRHLVSRR